jgi:hypothetical protein
MSQRIKRLFLIIVISVIVILLAKSLLGRAIKNLSVEVQTKQNAKAVKPSPVIPSSAPLDQTVLPDSTIIAGSQAESAPVVDASTR